MPVALRFEENGDRVDGKSSAAFLSSDEIYGGAEGLESSRLRSIWCLVRALYTATSAHLALCDAELGQMTDAAICSARGEVESVLAAATDCLLHFVFSSDAVLHCLSLSTVYPLDHIMGIFETSVSDYLDDGFVATDFESLAHPTLQERSGLGSGGRTTHAAGAGFGGTSTNAFETDNDEVRGPSHSFEMAYRNRFCQKVRPLSKHNTVYAALIDLCRLVVSRYSANFQAPAVLSLFQSLTNEIFAVLMSLEPTVENLSVDPKVPQRVANMLEFASHLMEACEHAHSSVLKGASSVNVTTDEKSAAEERFSIDSCFPTLVQILSDTSHPVILSHTAAFINTCVRVFELLHRSHRGLLDERKIGRDNYFDTALDIYCSTFSRSFDVAVNTLSVDDAIKILLVKNKPDRKKNERNSEMRRARGIVKGMCDGLQGLVNHATAYAGRLDPAALLVALRRLVAITKSMMATFVELAGHLLEKSLFCYIIAPGTGAATLMQYFWEGSVESSQDNCLQFLRYLLRPMATAYEGIIMVGCALQSAVFKGFAEFSNMQSEDSLLLTLLDDLISIDLCDTALLRTLWAYVGLFGFIGSPGTGPLQTMANCCDSIMLSPLSHFRRIYECFLCPNSTSLDKKNMEKWSEIFEWKGGARGKYFFLELEACLIDQVVRKCAKCRYLKGEIIETDKFDSKYYKFFTGAIISLLNKNLGAVTDWNKHGRFVISADLSSIGVDGVMQEAIMPPIGELSASVSGMINEINRSEIFSLDLPSRLSLSAVLTLEALRMSYTSDSQRSIRAPDEPAVISYLLCYAFDVQMHSHHKATKAERNFWNCVHGVIFSLWQRWCALSGRMLRGADCLSAAPLHRRRRQEVVDSMVYLLTQLSDPCNNALLRRFTLVCLYALINMCPWCLWNAEILSHLFSMCSHLEETRSDATEKVSSIYQEENVNADSSGAHLVPNATLSAVSVTFLSLTYHWCSMGVHCYSSLMTSAMLDYQLLMTHPFLQGRVQAKSVDKDLDMHIDFRNAPLGLEIAVEMCASEGIPTFQFTAAHGDNPFSGNGVIYSKLTRNNMESYPLAIERRRAAANIAESFRAFVLVAEKEGNKNDVFPLRWAIRSDIGSLRYIDLAARSYIFGSLLDTPAREDRGSSSGRRWTSCHDLRRMAAYQKIVESFSFSSNGLLSCWLGIQNGSIHTVGRLQEYIEELHRCILLAAGFVHLSLQGDINDGHVLSCLSVIAQCMKVNFTEETAKVVTGVFLWLLSAHPVHVIAVVLEELSGVLRFSSETFMGIFARRESSHSGVRSSGDNLDAGEEGSHDNPTLVAVPTLFSSHAVVSLDKDRYMPSVGDQIAAHVVLIDFLDYIFEILMVRRDYSCILFFCLETVLMNPAIFPSMYLLGSVSTSNAGKISASRFAVGIGAPMFRLLGFGLKLLRHHSQISGEAEVEHASCYGSTPYNLSTLSLLRYCEIHDCTFNSSIFNLEMKAAGSALSNTYLLGRLTSSASAVSASRRRILRERIYSFTLTIFNSPNSSLNNSPRPNAHIKKGTLVPANRSIDSEIKVLLEFMDMLRSDADSCWDRDYGIITGSASDLCGPRNRRAGPYEVIRWVDRTFFAWHGGIERADTAVGDEVHSVLFNPRSIFAHQRKLALGSQFKLIPPEDDVEAHMSEASVAMQRFCGVNVGASAVVETGVVMPGDKERDKVTRLRAITGVLHLARMCVCVQLDRMYAWRAVMYEELRRHNMQRKSCPVMSDFQFSTIEYNISRRDEVLNYFRECCCTKSGVHAAVLAAWAFHPSLALRIDQAFQYRALTHDNSSKSISIVYDCRIGEIVRVLTANMNEEPHFMPHKLSTTARAKLKRLSLKALSTKIKNQLYELCWPRISDLIANNPVALRADYSSAGYVLGIVGDVTFRTAHKISAKGASQKASHRALSQLRMWAIYGDKTVHTVFSRLGQRDGDKNATDVNWNVEYELNYHRNSLVRQQHQRAVKKITSHRAAHCPMYLLSHWALAPPDYVIGLLQRPILTHLGKTISGGGLEADDERQLERWQERLHAQSFVVQYVIRSLSALDPETLLFYLPQLVQLLRRDTLGAIRDFLEEKAKTSDLLCHQLVWLLETESISEAEAESMLHGKNENTVGIKAESADNKNNESVIMQRSEVHAAATHRHGYCNQLAGFDSLPSQAQQLHHLIVSSLDPRARAYMDLECEYFNTVTNISAKLALVKNKELHNGIIQEELVKIGLHKGLYLPTDPHRLLVGVNVNSGTPMQSAAKCPFLLVFHTMAWGGPDSIDTACVADHISLNEDNCLNMTIEKPSILSNKVVPSALQPVRIRNASVTDAAGLDIDGIALSPKGGRGTEGTPRDIQLTDVRESEIPLDEGADADEEGSDDPSREFANIRKSRAQYRTLLVNNYDDDMNEALTLEKRQSSGNDSSSNSKVYSVTSTKKDLYKSIDQLSHARGLRKGTQKWCDRSIETAGGSSIGRGGGSRAATGPVLNTACIFKVYDDCRQDALTIQFIRILYDTYTLEHRMPLYLYPYRVVPNRTGRNQAMGGIIQVIPDVRSRDDIGKSGAKTLLQHFRSSE